MTDSEAQAFADLLGEILPKSLASIPPGAKNKRSMDLAGGGGGGGVLDLFGSTSAASGLGDGIGQIQSALRRKLLKQARASESRASREQYQTTRITVELSGAEELELDRMKEIMDAARDDSELYLWSLESIFGFPASATTSLFPDPGLLPQTIPNPRLYPSLLLHAFLLLRDTHRSPPTALRIFSLASSNADSYILGCSSRLYYEVLATRWKEEHDIVGVLQGLEEMQGGGVRIGGGRDEEKFKELVREIGESIRVDRERTEASIERDGTWMDEREFEREVARRRYWNKLEVRAWNKMEKMLEDLQDELEDQRREKKDEMWRIEERQREMRARLERDSELDNEAGERDFGSREEESLRYDDEAEDEKPSLFSHRSDAPPLSSTSTHRHSPNRRAGLSPFENAPRPRTQTWEDGALSWKERDELRGLPKRPSFANPYKIRRKSLTKDEKSRKDQKHPMLFWK